MNRSYSRFVPHSRPVQPRRHVSSGREMVFRPHTAMVSRPVYRQRTVSSDSQPPKSGRSYWFPIATMMAAVLFTVSAIMPRSIFDAFAADEDSFRVGIESLPGSYTVTVTGGNSTGIELPAENALKTVNNDGTVTFRIDLDEETDYAIESTSAMTSVAFGNVEASDTDEEEKNQNDEDAKNEADGEDAEEENEGEEITPRSGAEAIKAIDLSRSGVTTLDISKCTGQTSLNISGTPLEQNASSIVFGNTSGGRVELSVPAFNKVNEEGVQFELVGLGEADDLTVKLANGAAVSLYEAENLEGVHYYIPYADLKTAFGSGESSEIQITNSNQPSVVYVIPLSQSNFNIEIPSNSEGNATTPTTATDNSGKTTTTRITTPTGTGDSKDDTENSTPNVKLTIDDKSKTIIKDAYIENVKGVETGNYKIVAKALSTADKKTFVAAIKKADKDFNENNPSVIYDIYVADSKGNKVDLKGKAAVTATLAYPSYEVQYLRNEYSYAVYHQLADKSIDTSISASPVGDGIQFTTDSFSKFAVSCSKKEQKFSDLVIHEDSKKIISAAKAHEGTYFIVKDEAFEGEKIAADVTWILAEAPTADEKKEFFDAIKKVNKDFNEKDSNLIVYKVSLKNIQSDLPSYVSENGKVDFTLAYPNDTLKKNYSKYNYTVYHQLADKSIDTKQLAIGGKDGITITTDSFSLFAVASTPRPKGSDNPKTGETNVSANIALLLAMLSMMSFTAVYTKNRGEQY